MVPLVEVDDRKVGTGVPGPVTKHLLELYRRAVRGELDRYKTWNEYVEDSVPRHGEPRLQALLRCASADLPCGPESATGRGGPHAGARCHVDLVLTIGPSHTLRDAARACGRGTSARRSSTTTTATARDPHRARRPRRVAEGDDPDAEMAGDHLTQTLSWRIRSGRSTRRRRQCCAAGSGIWWCARMGPWSESCRCAMSCVAGRNSPPTRTRELGRFSFVRRVSR